MQKLRLDDHAEVLVAVMYQITHIGFIIGSVFFLPSLEKRHDGEYIGEILFVVCSALLLFINLNDLFEIYKYTTNTSSCNNKTKPVQFHPSFVHHSSQKSTRYEILAAVMYATGSMLFLLGSILFIWYPVTGGWFFVIGSVAFIFGAFVNSFQIWDSPDSRSAQMANTISMLYAVASTIFFTASFPYAYIFHDERDAHNMLEEAAVGFILGSILFFVNGLLDLRRSHYIHHQKFFRNDDECVCCENNNSSITAVGAANTKQASSLSIMGSEEEA